MLTACSVGPDFVTPDAPEVASFTTTSLETSDDLKLVPQEHIPERWWTIFGSGEIEQLVTRGLEASPTLAAARSRLIAQIESYEAEHGSFWYPEISADISSTRQSTSGAAFGSTTGFDYTVHNASINVGYSITPFGAGQRFLEASEAQVEFEAIQLEATRQTLAANIVTGAFTEASLREQLAASRSIIEDESELLSLIEKQYEIGVIPRAELLAQQAAVAESRTRIPALEKALAASRNALAALLGIFPEQIATLPQVSLDALSMPERIPVTLPSTLTQRRPDIRAAQSLLHQASANIGVATANLYPSIGLTASVGKESTKFSDLFSDGTSVWGVAAGITQPLFEGGSLRARKRSAEATYDEVAALYRQSVIDAFVDVADSMTALQLDSRQYALQKDAERLTRERRELINEQYKQGAASYLALLDAQRQHQQARIALIEARVMLLNDTAILLHSLGGGWDGVVVYEQEDQAESS